MYVVIGATGNTGSVVANKLLAQKQKVRVIGRSADRLQPLAKLGAELFIGNITDAGALTRAFTGAQAVYLMLPPDMSSHDVLAHEEQILDAFIPALEKTKVKHAVALSSIGADKSEKTGPVIGLHNMEQKLNQISGLNILYLRAGYFMENTLGQIGIINAMGKTAGPVRGDLKLPMIATRDIGNFAADALLKLDFKGKQTQELLGQRDLEYNEVAAIIGNAISRPGLEYIALPDEQTRPALLQMGMSPNMAGLILEMSASLNNGHMKPLEKRSPQNTTPTSYEAFVAEEFVPAFHSKQAA